MLSTQDNQQPEYSPRYFDKQTKTQAFPKGDVPAHIVELPADNVFWQELRPGYEILYENGLPVSTVPTTQTREEEIASIKQKRKLAYEFRSDPMYMQWQYDQTPAAEQLWRAEVAAIKQENPWPV